MPSHPSGDKAAAWWHIRAPPDQRRKAEGGMRLGKWMGFFATGAVFLAAASTAEAATCGRTGANFESWKASFSAEAKQNGIKSKAIAALMNTSYSTATIRADRSQKSFKLSLSAFMAKRGAPAIVSRGRVRKRSNAALFASIERRYGVPPGPLLGIWGMETGFGNIAGKQHTRSAVATRAS